MNAVYTFEKINFSRWLLCLLTGLSLAAVCLGLLQCSGGGLAVIGTLIGAGGIMFLLANGKGFRPHAHQGLGTMLYGFSSGLCLMASYAPTTLFPKAGDTQIQVSAVALGLMSLALGIGYYLATRGKTGLAPIRFRRWIDYSAISVAIWVAGIGVVKIFGPSFFDTQEIWFPLLLGGSIAGNITTFWILKHLFAWQKGEALPHAMALSLPACLLDTLTFSFYPELYHTDMATSGMVGLWLVWYFGWGIVAGHILEA